MLAKFSFRKTDILTSNSHLPHSSKQLNKSTVCIRTTDHYGGDRDTAGLCVDQTQNESRESEGAETQWGRVSKLPEARLVWCRLECTTKSGHHGGLLSIERRSMAIDSVGCIVVVYVADMGGRWVGGLKVTSLL